MADDELGSFFAEIETLESSQPTVDVKVIAASAPAVKATPQILPSYNQSIPKISDFPSVSRSDSHSAQAAKSSSLSYFTQQATTTTTTTTAKTDKKFIRAGGGETWVDPTLNEWPENDFRLFIGDVGKEVTHEMLEKIFSHYKSFAKCKLIKSKTENKGRGYGFVSFLDPMECAKAFREMNGKYLGLRPMTVKMSDWKDRNIEEVKKKEKKKRKFQESLGLN